MTKPTLEELDNNKEPMVSILGVLIDIDAGQMTPEEGSEEIKKHIKLFKLQRDKELVEMIRHIQIEKKDINAAEYLEKAIALIQSQ